MNPDAPCVFCRIVAKEIPASIVYETPYVVSFLDVNPLADGHLIVIPREHYSRLDELPLEVGKEVLGVLPALGKALISVTGAAGYNLLQNNGEAAGQVVSHLHFHLVPRNDGDGLGYRWNAGTYASGRDVQLADAYRNALS